MVNSEYGLPEALQFSWYFLFYFAFVISQVIRAHRCQVTTGKEGLVDKTAVVKVALEPEGTVFFKGERWTAISDRGRVEPEEEVIITKVDGLKLYVTKKE